MMKVSSYLTSYHSSEEKSHQTSGFITQIPTQIKEQILLRGMLLPGFLKRKGFSLHRLNLYPIPGKESKTFRRFKSRKWYVFYNTAQVNTKNTLSAGEYIFSTFLTLLKQNHISQDLPGQGCENNG